MIRRPVRAMEVQVGDTLIELQNAIVVGVDPRPLDFGGDDEPCVVIDAEADEWYGMEIRVYDCDHTFLVTRYEGEEDE